MPVSHKKPADQRQGNGARKKSASIVALPTAEALAPPAPPTGLLRKSRDRWFAFWESPVGQTVDRGSDLYRLERWIRYVDEYERMIDLFRKTPLVKGSTGQPRLSPLRDRVNDLERHIAQAESEFGMTPWARLKLGIALGEATRSLEGLAADALAYDDEDEVDPRSLDLGPATIVGEVV